MIPAPIVQMTRRPKNKNKSKLRGLLRLGEASSVVALAAELGVHRTTMYRWMRQKNALASAAPNKYYASVPSRQKLYVKHPNLEQRLLSWITEMRKNRSLCVSMQCLLLMHSRFDGELFTSRSRGANIEFLRRFLKRNRLSITRITHKGRKIRSDMEIMLLVASKFSHSIQYAIEECGALSYATGPSKYGSVLNMDQTAIYIDMNGKTRIDFVGTPTVDLHQPRELNCPPLVFFAGIPGGPVSQDVWNPSFGHSSCEHTVQKKAFCNEAVMQEWIQRFLNCYGTRSENPQLLLLDSLKVHKMNSVRTVLEEDCCTQVEFVSPGITGLAQPMDVAVMKPFKDYVRTSYLAYHIDHEFPKTPQEKQGWASISPATIRKGFAKSGILPTGPRDIEDRFRVLTYAEEEAPILEVDQEE
ncbi:DDE superfamily endonuclease [Phytophthora infestans]|uniref:DDE superfamily endonuclease n=1 Tax=Phytophthora infestans TaxID=4787 RepID=A0A8S9TS73_PHYIN|nr:DDE superfamily endonuclease [Phytophthora infestans]